MASMRFLPLLALILFAGCAQVSNYFSGSGLMGSSVPGELSASDRTRDGRLKFARLCERKEQYDQAEKIYQLLYDEDPKDVEVIHRLGVVAAREGRLPKAIEYFNTAAELKKPSPDLLCDMGYCYYLQNRWSDAERTLRKALQDQPNHPRACTNLGLVLGMTGRYDESLALFRRCGTEAQAQANLGFVYSQIGAEKEALECYHLALAADPEMRSAAEALAQLAQRQDIRKRNLELAQRTNASQQIAAALPGSNDAVEVREGRDLAAIRGGAFTLAAGEAPANAATQNAVMQASATMDPRFATPFGPGHPAGLPADENDNFGFSGAMVSDQPGR